MSRQGNKYEKTVAFVVIPFIESEGRMIQESDRIYLQEEFELPVSKRKYKATLKNVEVFIEEYLQIHSEVISIRLDRISHIKVYER